MRHYKYKKDVMISPQSAVNPGVDKQLIMYEYWYLDIYMVVPFMEICHHLVHRWRIIKGVKRVRCFTNF